MPTMNVSLPKEFAEFVESEVASGEYGTASEVVRESLRLLRREKALEAEKRAVLRRELGIGLSDAHAGRFSERSVSDILESTRRHGDDGGDDGRDDG